MRNHLWMTLLTVTALSFTGLSVHAKPKPAADTDQQNSNRDDGQANHSDDEKPIKKSIAKTDKAKQADNEEDDEKPSQKSVAKSAKTKQADNEEDDEKPAKKSVAKTEKTKQADDEEKPLTKKSSLQKADASSAAVSDKKIARIVRQIDDMKLQLDQLEKQVKTLDSAVSDKKEADAQPGAKLKKRTVDEEGSDKAAVKSSTPKLKKQKDSEEKDD